MNLFSCMATNNKCYIANMQGKYKFSDVKGIIVHSTGANNKTLKRYVQPTKGTAGYTNLLKKIGENKNGNSWNTNKDEKCVHAFIGTLADGSVATAKILPWSYVCWGCGGGSKGSYNYSPNRHLQFEVCEDDLKDKSYFEKAVKGEAVELCAYLCDLYELPISAVISHHEAHEKGYASNHSDIDAWLKKFGYTMKDFRSWVTKAMKKYAEPEPFKAYTVIVTAAALNIRAGAGTNYKITGTIRDKGKYTIVEEASGKGATKWGKLKSGAGWISLDYCKKG